MKKINVLLVLLFSALILNACASVKEGFGSKKKNSTDEFLVKKKSPLVMPPDFDELPVPENNNQSLKNKEEADIKSLITNNDSSSSEKENNSNQNNNIKNSILDKIKNN
tara:strand:+ start:419 stop:745 length:327 start_codon:yes stop_codon:yes gene_type:complete